MSERFHLATPPVAGQAALSGDEARHLVRVLRAKVGDRVVLFDGAGSRWLAEITAINRDRVELRTEPPITEAIPPGAAFALAVALPKGERQQWMVEKLTELGVARLVPLITTRGVALPTAAACARLERTVIEACKQCGRDRLMVIDEPATVGDALRRQPAGTSLLLADPAGDTAAPAATAGPVLVLVGPEGGFTAEEIAAAEGAGARRVALARHVLRIETAAIAAAARFF
ncbi:MAG: RsmE family RNA methyltransferase [Pirellulales bacterium]